MQSLNISRAVKPMAHPYPTPEPMIDFRNRAIIFRYAEIVHPAPDILRKLLHAVFHRHEPTSAGQLFDFPFKLMESIVRPSNLGSLKRKTQKVRVIGFSNTAFILVDLEFEPTVEEPLDTSGHSHSRPVTFHKYEKIIHSHTETFFDVFPGFIDRIMGRPFWPKPITEV
jgi:hypothetical protein